MTIKPFKPLFLEEGKRPSFYLLIVDNLPYRIIYTRYPVSYMKRLRKRVKKEGRIPPSLFEICPIQVIWEDEDEGLSIQEKLDKLNANFVLQYLNLLFT